MKVSTRPATGNLLYNLNSSVGAIFFSKKTGRILFLLRAGDRYKNTWAFVGGRVESNETIVEALFREITEEIGSIPEHIKVIPLDKFTNTNKKFEYHTYVIVVEEEFIPKLNSEHKGYAWTDTQTLPKPLHPGVFSTLNAQEIYLKLKTVSELFVDSA